MRSRTLLLSALIGSLNFACGSRSDLLNEFGGSAGDGGSSGGGNSSGSGTQASGAMPTMAGESSDGGAEANTSSGSTTCTTVGCLSAPLRSQGTGTRYNLDFADAGADADAGFCLSLAPTASDQICTASTDCAVVVSGNLCPGQCACGNTAINMAGYATYQQALAPLQLGACSCPAIGVPSCVSGQCVLCGVGSNQPDGCADAF
jgi:hypothetical protein